MEHEFSEQPRSFQELLLREAKDDKGINLLSTLKMFVSFSAKPFHLISSCLCF